MIKKTKERKIKTVTLRHLKIFVAVCQTNSITRAAEKLYISQPSVSIAIKEMEEYYNQPLFERFHRKLQISPFGKELYLHAQRIVALFDEMNQMASSSKFDNRVRIGAGTTVGQVMVPDIIHDFCSTHPQAEITVMIDKVSALKHALMENKIDFAVAESLSEDPSIKVLATIKTPLVAVCNRENPLSTRDEVYAADLADEPILARQPGSYTRHMVDKYFEDHNLELKPKWESIDGLALLNGVRKNLGISFHAMNHVKALCSPELVILNLKDFEVTYQYSIFTHRDKNLTPIMADLIKSFVSVSDS